MQAKVIARELFQEINRLRCQPQKYVELVIDEFRKNESNYRFEEFQIIVNMLEIQKPIGKLVWNENIYEVCFNQLEQQQFEEPNLIDQTYKYVQCIDFGPKSVQQHLISLLVNGNIKKLMDETLREAGISIKENQNSNERIVLVKMCEKYVEMDRQTQYEIAARKQQMYDNLKNQKVQTERASFLKDINKSIKSNLDKMGGKARDLTNEDTQFYLIGKSKLAMNEYLKYYYQDNTKNDTNNYEFKVQDTYQDKESRKQQQRINSMFRKSQNNSILNQSNLCNQCYPPQHRTQRLFNSRSLQKSGNGEQNDVSFNNDNTQYMKETKNSYLRNEIKMQQNYDRQKKWLIDDVLAYNFKFEQDNELFVEQEQYDNKIEMKLAQNRQKNQQKKVSKKQYQEIGARLHSKKTIVQQIKEFQIQEQNNPNVKKKKSVQQQHQYQQNQQYYDPEKDKLQFKEVKDIQVDPMFMESFVIYFNNHFESIKKAKLILESVDKLYVFLKQYFRDLNVPYRLFRNGNEKHNFFELNDSFDIFIDILRSFLKIYGISTNYTQFNLLFCLNLIEHFTVFRQFVIKKFDKNKMIDLDQGLCETNFHYLPDFIDQVLRIYHDYTDNKNNVEIECIYDLVNQTIMENGYRIYVRDSNGVFQEVYDVQDDPLLHQIITSQIQEAFLKIAEERMLQNNNKIYKDQKIQFVVNFEELKVIISKVFKNKNILINKQYRENNEQLYLFQRKTNPQKKVDAEYYNRTDMQEFVYGNQLKDKLLSQKKKKNLKDKQQHEKQEKILQKQKKIMNARKSEYHIERSQSPQKMNKSFNKSLNRSLNKSGHVSNEYVKKVDRKSRKIGKSSYNYNMVNEQENVEESQQQEKHINIQQQLAVHKKTDSDHNRQVKYQNNYVNNNQNNYVNNNQNNHNHNQNIQNNYNNQENYNEQYNDNEYKYQNNQNRVTEVVSSRNRTYLRVNSQNYGQLLQLLSNDRIIERILSFLSDIEIVLLIQTSKKIGTLILQFQKRVYSIQNQKVDNELDLIYLKEELANEFNVEHIESGKKVRVYRLINQLERRVSTEVQLPNNDLYKHRLTLRDLQLIQQEASLYKVLIIVYILVEQYDNLKMNEDLNQFYFTTDQYFYENTLAQILSDMNKKKQIQQKIQLINLIFDEESFMELRSKDIIASAISPIFYFLHLYVQNYLALIGIQIARQLFNSYQQQDDEEGYQLMIQNESWNNKGHQFRLKEEKRYIVHRKSIYSQLNRFFQ